MTKESFIQYMKENHGSDNPVFRSWLTSEEIKIANQMVKNGELFKGLSHCGKVIFYMEFPSWYYSNH